VAIKIYEKAKIRDLQRRKGVRREVKLLQKLNHNNIVKIIDTVESNNHINIIMEYVAGGSLHSLLKKQQVT
jgi:MAP/microtubule affinity-regulating kinase